MLAKINFDLFVFFVKDPSRVGKDIYVNGKVAIDGVFLRSNDTFYESKYPAVILDMHIIQISILYFQVSHFKDI